MMNIQKLILITLITSNALLHASNSADLTLSLDPQSGFYIDDKNQTYHVSSIIKTTLLQGNSIQELKKSVIKTGMNVSRSFYKNNKTLVVKKIDRATFVNTCDPTHTFTVDRDTLAIDAQPHMVNIPFSKKTLSRYNLYDIMPVDATDKEDKKWFLMWDEAQQKYKLPDYIVIVYQDPSGVTVTLEDGTQIQA